MKTKTIIVTLWFNRYNDMKNMCEVFVRNLNEYFQSFKLSNIPLDVDPVIPRITSTSKSGNSTIKMSHVNLQLATKFEGDYSEDFDSCIAHMKAKAKKVYDLLHENNINVIYSAVFIVLNKEMDNPVQSLYHNLMNPNIDGSVLSEAGIRVSMPVENSFYRIITINNAKDYTIQKQLNPGEHEIVLPLVSLRDAKIEKESLTIKYELNDKYSFDHELDYSCNSENFDRMFDIVENDVRENIEKFLDTGKID